MKKSFLSGMLILLILPGLFSLGKKDTVETSAGTLDSWLETVDISEKKPGKYNILVTAEDLAGNQALAGPYNMFIDPDSDLPVARITNPLHDMRVPGNLNVVGTCLDDDAVDHVEIMFDGGEPVRAEGTEFWSYYLDTNGLAEGVHIISVYGVDIYGVQGRPNTVMWNLDRNQPETLVQDPAQMGALVSGKFRLSGIVTDGNGIERLSYSLDGGETFEPVKLAFDKKERQWSFSFTINSLKMDDGPSVCWFKAEDLQGSIGIYTFLFFVDNTKPTVDFITPAAGESVNGKFSVTGFAKDTNGIAAVGWKYGKETGVFDLVKGNPYWIKEFDLTGQKLKNFEVSIYATDIAGNTSVVTRKIPVDPLADVPELTVTAPEPESVQDAERVTLAGIARDDDGIKEVWYSIDKNPAVRLDSVGAFGVELDGLSAGAHVIEAWPVDLSGIRGPSVKVPFTLAGKPPAVTVEPVVAPNREIHPEAGARIAASVQSDAGLASVFWQLDGFPETPLKIKPGAKEARLDIPVGYGVPFGIVTATVRAVDIYGRETSGTTQFYVTNLGIPRDTPSEFSEETLSSSGDVQIPASGKVPASVGTATVAIENILPADVRFENGMLVTLAGPLAPKAEQLNGAISIGIDSPVAVTGVSWSLNGSAPVKASAAKTPEGRYVAQIPLKAQLPAEWTTLEATVTFKDLSTQSVSAVFCVVRPESPGGTNDAEQFAWDQAATDSDGSIALFDGAVAAGLYNGKNDRAAASVAFETPVEGLEVSLESNVVRVRAHADGRYPDVVCVITDTAGETFTTVPTTFIADAGVPALALDTSERPVWLQYELPVKGEASDASGIASVEYSFDGGVSWTAFAAPAFDEKIDIAGLPDGKIEFLVRATDVFGRQTSDWRVFMKDTSVPDVSVVIPEAGATVNGETRIAFKAEGEGPIVSAEYRAPGDRSETDATEWWPFEVTSNPTVMVGTLEQPLKADMEFRFTDAAGNQTSVRQYPFTIDSEADRPTVEIHVPAENEVLRKDFIISGVVYDDDQPAKVWYKIDAGEYTEVAIENSFSIPVALSSLTDNEHTISMYAEDIHGIRGDEVIRMIRVSLEEPKAAVESPSFETTNSGMIDITGVASDKNGISRVEISLDNGNSYNLAAGAEEWQYRFDSRVIQDGTHVVFVRVYDNYETSGLYSSLINIDNTAPSIKLELPLDGSRSATRLFISGQTLDNIGLDRVAARIRNIDPKQPAIPAALDEIPFDNELIISRGIDISSLPEGFFNLEVRGYDKAGNITRVSRNFEVYRAVDRNRIEFLYPLNGEHVQGMFNIYGKVISEEHVNNLMLFIDGSDVDVTELSPSGYFQFTVTPEMIADGMHNLSVRALVSGDKIIYSEEHAVDYRADGPWITIDNLVMGDFAIDRPWLMGTTGYSLTEEEVIALRAKDTPAETRRIIREKSLAKVEISFDNGKTFVETESGKKWRYRIETGDLAEGYHFLIVRSTMRNGELAVSRSIIQIDKTNPSIRLISPGEGGLYNNELTFSGLSSDDVKLKNVTLALRPGDKSAYAVPSFIQGLYFDWHFWGATLYDVGLGLTFFDDNVKLQGQFGQFTQEQRALFTPEAMRYGGNVLGVKLLANIASLPMEYYFGPDFSWLSATGAVGANFSWFSETQSGKPQILSAVLGQFEFPRVTIPKRKMFRTFSLYSEMEFWFIPTDVDSAEVDISSIIPHITGGIRVNVF